MLPHHARTVSESGYYHVVPKGIADQIVFSDDEDKLLYVDLLRQAKELLGVHVHAYCLMSNHVHLILEASCENVSACIKYVHERYAMHNRNRTGRLGGTFRQHTWSEPIETDAHLLCAVRYVHANPAVAGICAASAYNWSSAKDYLGRLGIADTQTVLAMLGGEKGFIEWSKAARSTAKPFPGSKLSNHLTDEEFSTLASSILGYDPRTLIKASIREQERAVGLLSSRGFPASRIYRLTGIGRKLVDRYVRQYRGES